jgi:uncharacterized protein
MSGGLKTWYSLPDLMALAKRGQVLEGTLALERFGRLSELLHSSEGEASARLEFRLGHDDMLQLQLQYAARLELTCQRCLESMVHEVNERIDFAVAETEDSLAVLPQGVDLISLEGDRFQPATLIEDELIVSLPLVPRHGDAEP